MNGKNRSDVEPMLLRIRDAATMLAVSERSVWQLVRAGELSPIHPPGMRAIRIAGTTLKILSSAGTITMNPPTIRTHEHLQALQPRRSARGRHAEPVLLRNVAAVRTSLVLLLSRE